MIDTTESIETPESIDLELTLAGPIVRILAFAIDSIIKLFLYVMLGMILRYGGDIGSSIFLILMFITEWFYPVLFEMLNNGQTPGKRYMGICVVSDSGRPLDWGSSMIRNLIRFIDFLPIGYVVGLISIAMTRDFKRLGDLAGNTLVIYTKKHLANASQPETLANSEQTEQSLTALAPPIPLSVEQQRAIIAFSERRHYLSESRAIEIANTLAHFVNAKDQEAVDKLLQMSHWLKGHR